MALFWRALGAVLLSVTVGLALPARDKTFHTVLTMGVCTLSLLALGEYLRPVLRFMEELEKLGNLQPQLVQILFKASGIAIVTEIAALLCDDSGNSSQGKALRLLCAGVVLCISLPVFEGLLSLLQTVLEGL